MSAELRESEFVLATCKAFVECLRRLGCSGNLASGRITRIYGTEYKGYVGILSGFTKSSEHHPRGGSKVFHKAPESPPGAHTTTHCACLEFDTSVLIKVLNSRKCLKS